MKESGAKLVVRFYQPTKNRHGKVLVPNCAYHPLRPAEKVVGGTADNGIPIQIIVCTPCSKMLLAGEKPIRHIPESMLNHQKEFVMNQFSPSPKPSAKATASKTAKSPKKVSKATKKVKTKKSVEKKTTGTVVLGFVEKNKAGASQSSVAAELNRQFPNKKSGLRAAAILRWYTEAGKLREKDGKFFSK